MIIGPPGAGKTTAIKHSGLVFPFQGAGRRRRARRRRHAQLRLVVHERGHPPRHRRPLRDRVATTATSGSRSSRCSSKYRTRRPINGVLVAISIAELIDANEQQLEATGKKLRARIDEVMTQLHMVVPVYVLFTKCDLIAGFNEFFGDMRKSDRAQAWGATLKLDMDKSNPGKIFDEEFEVLRKQIHAPRAEAPRHGAKPRGAREDLPVPARVRGRQAQPLRARRGHLRGQRVPGHAHLPRLLLHERHAGGPPARPRARAHGAGDGHPPARASRRSRSSSRRATSSTTCS